MTAADLGLDPGYASIPPNSLRDYLPDRRDQLWRYRFVAAVHHQNPYLAGLVDATGSLLLAISRS